MKMGLLFLLVFGCLSIVSQSGLLVFLFGSYFSTGVGYLFITLPLD